MAQNRRGHDRWHYRPGEIVIAVEFDDDEATRGQAHA